MREILFKAKRIDDGEWVEGYVFDDGFADSKRLFVGGLVIMDYKGTADDRWNVGTAFYEVIPDTICQYTGLTDKNGFKIWENDCIGHRLNVVEFLNGAWCVNGDRSLFFFAKEHKVIGNIFDNADLLGE